MAKSFYIDKTMITFLNKRKRHYQKERKRMQFKWYMSDITNYCVINHYHLKNKTFLFHISAEECPMLEDGILINEIHLSILHHIF